MKRCLWIGGLLLVLGYQVKAQSFVFREDVGFCDVYFERLSNQLFFDVQGSIDTRYRQRYQVQKIEISMTLWNDVLGGAVKIVTDLDAFDPAWIDDWEWYYQSSSFDLGRGPITALGTIRLYILDTVELVLYHSPISIYKNFELR